MQERVVQVSMDADIDKKETSLLNMTFRNWFSKWLCGGGSLILLGTIGAVAGWTATPSRRRSSGPTACFSGQQPRRLNNADNAGFPIKCAGQKSAALSRTAYTWSSTFRSICDQRSRGPRIECSHFDSRLHAIIVQEGSETTEDPANVADDLIDLESYANLPEGLPKGFYVVKKYTFLPDNSMDLQDLHLDPNHLDRLEVSPTNVTLPIALMVLNPETYPSLSRARKACRKGNILVRRAASEKIGRVGDRIYPGDVVCQQVRMGNGYFSSALGHRQPPFELPVIYEDDHFALVNKPAGVVVYRQGAGQHGLLSVRAALPFVLTPPQRGTYAVLRRPASVHRLDKPTSGLLCVVKTKPAMLSMSRQFHDRVVRKTYMAIVNGIPDERSESSLSTEEALQLGVDIDLKSSDPATRWQLIDSPLDEKNAVTVWRAVRYVPSLHALDGYLTLVELKPKTGRYHQLRRHLAWNCGRPIVGDAEYDGGTAQARKFRDHGLFLCASRVTHEHPYYNSDQGRETWDGLDYELKFANGLLWLSDDEKVMVSADVDLPDKFESLMAREENRFLKFQLPAQ